jgi:hypothetical protein
MFLGELQRALGSVANYATPAVKAVYARRDHGDHTLSVDHETRPIIHGCAILSATLLGLILY